MYELIIKKTNNWKITVIVVSPNFRLSTVRPSGVLYVLKKKCPKVSHVQRKM